MRLVDTHCHLTHPPLADDPAGVLERAAAVAVDRVVVPAYDRDTWPAVAALAAGFGNVHAAYGLHPWVAHTLDAEELRPALAGQLDADPAAVAVGEIGLDTKLPEGPDLPTQLAVLRVQLETARDGDLPVILHCRGAFEELLGEIDRFGGALRGVLHAWSRGPELAERFTAAGLKLGLGGAVTRDRARRLLRTVKRLPLESFVLETDAPSIGLEGVWPQDTEPRHVADIAGAVAALRGTPVDEVAAATTATATALFRLP